MNETLLNQINSLPYSDKAELLDYLLVQIAEEESKFELSGKQKKQLDESYEEYLANPDSAQDWDKVRKEIFKKP